MSTEVASKVASDKHIRLYEAINGLESCVIQIRNLKAKITGEDTPQKVSGEKPVEPSLLNVLDGEFTRIHNIRDEITEDLNQIDRHLFEV